jgi:hypothetical protein
MAVGARSGFAGRLTCAIAVSLQILSMLQQQQQQPRPQGYLRVAVNL